MNIYHDLAQFYDADLKGHTEDLSLYREMAQRTGGPILEMMCGTGRVLLPLAKAGFQLTGVDLSLPMLEIARPKIAAANLNDKISLLHGDACTIALPQKHFALAFIALNSFMHLTKIADQLATLANMHRSLTSEGLLLLDLFNPDPVALAKEDNRMILDRQYKLNERLIVKFTASESDLATQTNILTYFYDELDAEGHVTRQLSRFTIRWFYRYEIEHLLARAGFQLQAIYGSYELDSYTSESPRLLVVASPQ